MNNKNAHREVLSAAYEAVAQPELWTDVLARLCRLYDSTGVYTAVAQSAANKVLQSLSYNVPVDAISVYDEHVIRITPRVECMAGRPEREVFFSYRHTPEGRIKSCRCYQWLKRGNGFSDYLGYRSFEDDGVVAFISLQRARSQGQATEEQIGLFSEMAPHLNRALRLTARFEELSLGRKAMEQVTDRLPFAVFILDDCARLLYCNAAAERMSADDDGLAMSGGGIHLASATAGRQYASNFAIATGKAGGMASSIVCAARPSGKRAYVLWMAPITGAARGLFLQHASVILIATDPESAPRLPRDILMRACELTRREADVALQLAQGLSINEAAERLGIRRDTARSYLKSIFRKVDVNRQSALVRLVWSTTLGLADGDSVSPG